MKSWNITIPTQTSSGTRQSTVIEFMLLDEPAGEAGQHSVAEFGNIDATAA